MSRSNPPRAVCDRSRKGGSPALSMTRGRETWTGSPRDRSKYPDQCWDSTIVASRVIWSATRSSSSYGKTRAPLRYSQYAVHGRSNQWQDDATLSPARWVDFRMTRMRAGGTGEQRHRRASTQGRGAARWYQGQAGYISGSRVSRTMVPGERMRLVVSRTIWPP